MSNLFYFCILARTLLALSLLRYRWMGYILLIPATVWLLMNFGIIQRDTGPEAGGVIWWKDLRIYHSMMYFAAAYCVLHDKAKIATFILLIDVFAGAVMQHNYRNP